MKNTVAAANMTHQLLHTVNSQSVSRQLRPKKMLLLNAQPRTYRQSRILPTVFRQKQYYALAFVPTLLSIARLTEGADGRCRARARPIFRPSMVLPADWKRPVWRITMMLTMTPMEVALLLPSSFEAVWT